MCDPVSAMMAAQSVVKFAGEKSATDAYNAQASAAHRDARLAATYKYKDSQNKYNFDAKATNQEGYKAALKARAELGSLQASAGASGIAAGSLTLENLEAMSRQVAAENEARVDLKRDDAKESLVGQMVGIETEAKQRINSMPFKEGPNPLGLAIGLAGAGLKGGGYDVSSLKF